MCSPGRVRLFTSELWGGWAGGSLPKTLAQPSRYYRLRGPGDLCADDLCAGDRRRCQAPRGFDDRPGNRLYRGGCIHLGSSPRQFLPGCVQPGFDFALLVRKGENSGLCPDVVLFPAIGGRRCPHDDWCRGRGSSNVQSRRDVKGLCVPDGIPRFDDSPGGRKDKGLEKVPVHLLMLLCASLCWSHKQFLAFVRTFMRKNNRKTDVSKIEKLIASTSSTISFLSHAKSLLELVV